MKHASVGRQIGIAGEAGIYCFATAYTWQIASTGLLRHFDFRDLLVAACFPAASSLILMLLALVVPSLYGVGLLTVPLNFTIPMLWGSVCLALATLFGSGTSPILHMPTSALPAIYWSQPNDVLVVVMLQFVSLGIRVAFGAKVATPVESDEIRTSQSDHHIAP